MAFSTGRASTPAAFPRFAWVQATQASSPRSAPFPAKMEAARAVFTGARLGNRAMRHPAVRQHRDLSANALLQDVVMARDDRVAAEVVRPTIIPADADREKFQLHWTVDMWRSFDPAQWVRGIDGDAPLPTRLAAFTETLTNALGSTGILGSSEAARYWAYHVARSGFFATQGILAIAAARAAASRSNSPTAVTSRLETMARSRWQGPVSEALLQYYADYENIKEGRYGLPWDMTTGTHRQYNPLFIAQRAAAFVSEATVTLRRRERGSPEEIWMRSSLLPDYFQGGFHYQTDGWLSGASAKVYETSTETLFLGRQDAMQRCTLVPVSDFMKGKDASQVRALEVACGTGRFATFLKDNYPALDLTLSDLSPFYLAEARSNMAYWKAQRAADLALPGVDRNGTAFLQTPAEAIAAPDESFDLVYAVYLFHELPPEVRRQAAREMARVVKPGGMVVLTDSTQLGDRPAFDKVIGNFGDFNEPFYRSYLAEDLGSLFQEAGLECGLKVVGSTTKSLSFRKPLSTPEAEAAAPAAQPGAPKAEAGHAAAPSQKSDNLN